MKKEELKLTVEFIGKECGPDAMEGSTHVTSVADDLQQVLPMAECVVNGLCHGVFREARKNLPEDGGKAADMASAFGIILAVRNGAEKFLEELGIDPEEYFALQEVLKPFVNEERGAANGKVS